MAHTLRTPTDRTCERCGRIEVWDGDAGGWRVAAGADESDDRAVGSPYCIHEWDINGSFAPFEDAGTDAAEG
ncbi:HEWD family protein [Halobellus sp. GM3]|uniref:HEWD family protein n=1 Tax=Halobellus sp. GM3 TaxID=3458410 RepID=UPI00403DF4CA